MSIADTMQMSININAQNLMWTTQRQKSGRFVAWCDALGLTVEGDNQSDLQSAIGEAIHVLFVDLLSDGELAEFLRDRGWSMNGPAVAAIPQDGVVFNVPYGMLPAS